MIYSHNGALIIKNHFHKGSIMKFVTLSLLFFSINVLAKGHGRIIPVKKNIKGYYKIINKNSRTISNNSYEITCPSGLDLDINLSAHSKERSVQINNFTTDDEVCGLNITDQYNHYKKEFRYYPNGVFSVSFFKNSSYSEELVTSQNTNKLKYSWHTTINKDGKWITLTDSCIYQKVTDYDTN